MQDIFPEQICPELPINTRLGVFSYGAQGQPIHASYGAYAGHLDGKPYVAYDGMNYLQQIDANWGKEDVVRKLLEGI